jgi:hypothetical protein
MNHIKYSLIINQIGFNINLYKGHFMTKLNTKKIIFQEKLLLKGQ